MNFSIKSENIQFNEVSDNTLKGVVLIQEGIAKGHGVYIDAETLTSILEAKKKDKIPSKLGHYSANDGLYDVVGYFENLRIDEDKLRGDFTFVVTDLNKDRIDHIKKMAALDPNLFGISIDFRIKEFTKIKDKEYVRVEELYAADFVLHPAATDSLFEEQKTITEDKINNKNILNFKVMGLWNKFKKLFDTDGITFGEATTKEGIKIAFPGDSPELGDDLIVVETGEAAPDGEHIVGDKIYVIVEGKIAEIKDYVEDEAKEEEMPIDDEKDKEEVEEELSAESLSTDEINKYNNIKESFKNKEKQIMYKNAEIEELKAKLNALENQYSVTNKPISGAPSINTNAKAEFSSETFKRAYKIYHENRAEFSRLNAQAQSESGKNRNFSTGADFTDALSRCASWLPEVLYERIANDSLLSRFTLQQFVSPSSSANAPLQFIMPNNNFNPTNLWEVRDPNACTPFTPNGTASPNQRVIDVKYLEYNYELCPIEWKSIYNGFTWMGYNEFPTETGILIMMVDRLVRDLENIMLFGRTGPGGTITGLINEINNAVISTEIPASQVLTPYGAYSSATAIADVESLVDLLPFNMRNTPSQLFIADNAITNYFRNYRSAFNFGYAIKDLKDTRGNITIPDTADNIQFSPVNLLSLPTAQMAFITGPDNVRYILEDPSRMAAPEVYYDFNDRKVKFRFQTWAGINFAKAWEMVVNTN